MNFIRAHINLHGELGSDYLHRIDTYEIPLEALREALLNAVLHRDYSIKGSDIKVAIFDHAVEITSPGSFPRGITLEDILSGRSEVRNRVIARIFREAGIIEQWGRGIRNIIHICAENGNAKPVIKESAEYVKIIFIRKEFLYATESSKYVLQEKMDVNLYKKVDANISKSVDTNLNKKVDANQNQKVDANMPLSLDIKPVYAKNVRKKVDANSGKKVDANLNKKVDANSNKKVDANMPSSLDLKPVYAKKLRKKVDANPSKKVDANRNQKVDANSNKKVDANMPLSLDLKPVYAKNVHKKVDANLTKEVDANSGKKVDANLDGITRGENKNRQWKLIKKYLTQYEKIESTTVMTLLDVGKSRSSKILSEFVKDGVLLSEGIGRSIKYKLMKN
jgi:hypothetical protein